MQFSLLKTIAFYFLERENTTTKMINNKNDKGNKAQPRWRRTNVGISKDTFFGRQDSYYQYAATIAEKKEWLLQSIVPVIGLIVLFLFSMILYEVSTIAIGSTDAASTLLLKRSRIETYPSNPSEVCIRVYDFEKDAALYCDANKTVNLGSPFAETSASSNV